MERVYYPYHEEAALDAIVVYCSDPRFQEAFQAFPKLELGIEHVAPIVIPGSASALGVDMAMPKRLKALRDYIEFMASQGKDPRLIIINHEGCRMYARLEGLLRHVIPHQQMDDLRNALQAFPKWIPSLKKVEVYMARLAAVEGNPGKKVYFEKVA